MFEHRLFLFATRPALWSSAEFGRLVVVALLSVLEVCVGDITTTCDAGFARSLVIATEYSVTRCCFCRPELLLPTGYPRKRFRAKLKPTDGINHGGGLVLSSKSVLIFQFTLFNVKSECRIPSDCTVCSGLRRSSMQLCSAGM